MLDQEVDVLGGHVAIAVTNGNIELLRLLFQYGADADAGRRLATHPPIAIAIEEEEPLGKSSRF